MQYKLQLVQKVCTFKTNCFKLFLYKKLTVELDIVNFVLGGVNIVDSRDITVQNKSLDSCIKQ